MSVALQTTKLRSPRKFVTSIAKSEAEVREAQRLRWRVFADEGGAQLDSPPLHPYSGAGHRL
jgi:putative hemolysin